MIDFRATVFGRRSELEQSSLGKLRDRVAGVAAVALGVIALYLNARELKDPATWSQSNSVFL